MATHDPRLRESPVAPPGTRLPNVTATPHALAALHALCHAQGPQVIVVGSTCARLAVAQVGRESGHVPGPTEVRIGSLAHCPVYASLDSLEMCCHDGLILDLHPTGGQGAAAVFVTRPESRAEWQQRVFADRARDG